MLSFTRIVKNGRVVSASRPLRKPFSTNSPALQHKQDGDISQKQEKLEKPQEPQNSEERKLHKPKLKQTPPQTDEETRARLEEMLGNDGGIAGVELEGGKPVGLKRHVKGNMFRLI